MKGLVERQVYDVDDRTLVYGGERHGLLLDSPRRSEFIGCPTGEKGRRHIRVLSTPLENLDIEDEMITLKNPSQRQIEYVWEHLNDVVFICLEATFNSGVLV
jgi:hypothetical protein